MNGATWSYTLTPADHAAMGEGEETITATATDAAGNTGPAGSTSIVVDTAAPVAPAGLVYDAGGGATAPTMRGVAEAGAVIVLYDTDGTTVLGTATADADGLWSITSPALAEGEHTLTATATDAAGNLSELSLSFEVGGSDDLPPIHVTAAEASFQIEAGLYSGPVTYLRYQYAGTNSGEAVVSTSANDFVTLRAGDDAAGAGAGDDVLDGGTGSNFLTGGAGQDVFFLDGRGGETTWSTITDWSAGEHLSVWGWRPGVSRATWVADAGADGYRGATMHADLDGNGVTDTSVTWAGKARADIPVPTEQDGLLWFA